MTNDNTKPNNQADADRAIRRIKSLLLDELSYQEMSEILNSEGYKTIRGCKWTPINLRVVIFRLRHQCQSWYALSQKRANLTMEALT